MVTRIVYILVFILMFVGSVQSQEDDPSSHLEVTPPQRPSGVKEMELDEFIALGLAQNPVMQAAAQQVESARAQYEQVKSQKNPQLVLKDSTNLQRETSVSTNSLLPNSFVNNNTFPDEFVLVSPLTNQLQLSLQVLLTTFGKVENTIAAAFINIDTASASADIDKYNLIYSLKVAFFQKLKADAQVAVARQNLTVTNQNLTDTQALFEQGVQSRYDILQAEIEVTRSVEQLAQNLTDVDLAEAQIANVLNEHEFHAQPVSPPDAEVSPHIEVPALEQFALNHRAEMRAIEYSLASAQKLVDAAYGENQPTLTLAANYQTAFGQSLSPVNYPSLVLQLQWSIFDGGYRKAKVKEAKATLDKIEFQKVDLENQIILQVDQYWLKLKQTAFNVTTAQQQLSNATEYHDMARQRYINGLATSLEVSDSLRNLIAARANLVETKFDRDLAFSRLEQALGADVPNRKLTPDFLTSVQAEETPKP